MIDTPPHSATDAAEAARRADAVLTPVEPHLFALETVSKLADLLKVAGNPPAFFVINKAPTQGSEGANAAEFIKKQGFTVSPVIIYLRTAHRHASNVGKVAVEYEADSKAAQERYSSNRPAPPCLHSPERSRTRKARTRTSHPIARPRCLGSPSEPFLELPAARSVLHNPPYKFTERQSNMSRQLRNKRCRRHAWLSIDLETDKLARSPRPVVETKIGPAYAPAAQCIMSINCQFLDKLVNVR